MKYIKYKLLMLPLILMMFSGATNDDNITDAVASPVKITADAMKYYGNEKRTEFIGNVVGVSDNYTLTSDNVTVFMDDNNAIERIVGIGNVNVKTDNIVAIAEKGEVDETDKIAILSGGVKVWQDENFLEGDRVIIYYIDDRIEVEKGEEKRVTIIFNPTDTGELP